MTAIETGPRPSPGPPPRGGGNSNIGSAWRTQPGFRLLIILLPLLAIGALGLAFMGGAETAQGDAVVAQPPNLEGTPGQTAVSPEFARAQEEADRQRSAAAATTGRGSALFTPIAPVGATFPTPAATPEPLTDFMPPVVAVAEPPPPPGPPTTPDYARTDIQPSPQDTARAQATNELAGAMRRQMEALLDGWEPRPMQVILITEEYERPDREGVVDILTEGGAAAGGTGAASGVPLPGGAAPTVIGGAVAPADLGLSLAGAEIVPPIVSAGTVVYGQMLTAANSDVPGPVLARVLTGPTAGARLIGAFDATEDFLVLRFTLMVFQNREIPVDIVALDPDSSLAGVATDVDRHFFERFVLPAAAAFISGVAEAASTGNSTVTVNGETVVEETEELDLGEQLVAGGAAAADVVAEALSEAANREPTVTVASGTPVGLLFVTAAREPQ